MVRDITHVNADARAELLGLLRQMMLIRRFEEKAAEMYARGRIAGFLHLYIGQEAVAVGAEAAIGPEDYVVSHYREHGHALARGIEPGRIMAELFGKETGISKGRGGSMHLFDASRNFMGGYAIVAGHLPIACGLAIACQKKEARPIVLCFFGDGAVNEGAFHESLNLASLWKLPVVFVCENNLYGMGTQVARVSAEPSIYKRACSYNIAAEQVDGMDVIAVREAARVAVEHARGGKGPYFLEAMTYRFRGHSMADPELYRAKEEVAQWKAQDPINAFRDLLRERGLLDDAAFGEIEAEIDGIVAEAQRFAEESPAPDAATLFDNVYKE